MPHLPEFVTDCSVYLYETEQDAKEGNKGGGCGFLVHVPSEMHSSIGYLYAVTNKHVAEHCTTMRLTRKTGGIDTIPTKYGDWLLHPDGDDVAIFPFDISNETLARFKWWSISTADFITTEILDAYRIGIGDDAFMVGRLMSHDGRQRNAAVVRFGNISLMADPHELIQHANGEREGFLVECCSLSGFSGSPVFVMTTQRYSGEDAEQVVKFRSKGQIPPVAIRDGSEQRFAGQVVVQSLDLTNAGPWLLGIDWGHMKLYRTVERNGTPDVSLKVELNTGIACVAPAWKIMDILNEEELVKQRRKEDKRIKAQQDHESGSVNDSSKHDESFTKSDFEDALKKASRRLSGGK